MSTQAQSIEATPLDQPVGGLEPERRTTTTESLLGMLSLCPMSGYELRRMIETTIGNFWTESFGQIYPALKRMEAEGLLEVTVEESPGRPLRKVYRLTDAGRDRLIQWLAVPARSRVPRQELLLKLFFGYEQGPERSLEHVERFLAEQVYLLARYRAIEADLEQQRRDAPGMPYWRLTVRYGLWESEALIGWAKAAASELKELAARQTKS